MTKRGYMRGRVLPIFDIDAIDTHWPAIEGLLDRIVDEKVGLTDIYRLVTSGEWVLWLGVIPATREITFFVITSFVQYPQVKNLRIIFLAGDDEDWSNGIEVLEDFARNNLCHAVEVTGRKGWERTLKDSGYEFQNITLSKRIT